MPHPALHVLEHLAPVFVSNQRRFRASVATPSWTMRFWNKSMGSASPRFSCQRRRRAASSLPMITSGIGASHEQPSIETTVVGMGHITSATVRVVRRRERGVPIPEAAGVELGPPVLLEGEDLAHYERLLAQVTAEPWRRAISTRVSGRDRHERIPVILKTETSVLRAAALGRLEFDHDFTAPWRLLRGEDH